MLYATIEIFLSRVTGKVVICWDDNDSPDCTVGVYLETIGM